MSCHQRTSRAICVFPSTTKTAGKKTPVAFSFNPPVIAHTIQFTPNGVCRAWYEEIAPSMDIWPELVQESSSWLAAAGRSKPAYVRGFSMPIDTGGAAIAFLLRLDDNTTVA